MKGGNELTKEELGQLILSSERQLYATAKTILADDQDCADAIQESIAVCIKSITKKEYVSLRHILLFQQPLSGNCQIICFVKPVL